MSSSSFQSFPPPTPPAQPGGGGNDHPSTDAHSGGFGTVFLVLAVILVVSALACFLGRLCNRRSLSRQSKASGGHHDDHHRRHQQQHSTSQNHHAGGGGSRYGSGSGGGRGGGITNNTGGGKEERDMMGYGPKNGDYNHNDDIEFGLDEQRKPIPKIKIPASRYVDAATGRGQNGRRDEMEDDGRNGGGGFGRGGPAFTMMGSPANYR